MPRQGRCTAQLEGLGGRHYSCELRAGHQGMHEASSGTWGIPPVEWTGPRPEPAEHDGGIELLIRYAQELHAAQGDEGSAEWLRYWRELTYRSSLLLEGHLPELRQLLDALVREVAAARDAELHATAERRGLL